MRKLVDHSGFVRGAVLFLVLIVVVVAGMLYFTTRRGMDVADEAGDLEHAAQTVRDTSEDAILTAKVKTALALSKSVSALDINVDSDDGTVTLTGTVSSDGTRLAVLNIARDTAGVLTVVDRITVDSRAATGILRRETRERSIRHQAAGRPRVRAEWHSVGGNTE